MRVSIVLPSSKRTEASAATRSAPALSWPDRVGGARCGRPTPPLSERTQQDRCAAAALGSVLALIVGGILLANLHGPAIPDASAEKCLPADLSSSTLDATSALAPAPRVAPEFPNDPDHRVQLPAAPVSAPQPLAHDLHILEAPAVPPGEPSLLLDPEQPRASAFSSLPTGESPMMRTWKAVGLNTVLLAAFATPVLAGPEDAGKDDKAPATAKDIAEIKKMLQQLDQGVGRDIETLKKDMAQLQNDLKALKGNGPMTASSNYTPSAKEVDELRKQIDRLQQTVEALKQQLPQTSTSYKPAATNGRLELTNDYPYQIDFVVNETTYPVAPGMTRVLNLPVGAMYTFRIPQLAGYQTAQSRVLGSEGRAIRVYAQ